MLEPIDRDPAHLHAAILYLRPQVRPPLLTGLAELGIFVCEHADAESLAASHAARQVDVLVVVGEDDQAHASLASHLATRLSSALVAVLPAGESTSRYTAGSSVTTQDDELWDHFDAVIAPAAREARARREERADAIAQASVVDDNAGQAPFSLTRIPGLLLARLPLRRRSGDAEQLPVDRRLRLALIGATSTWNMALWGSLVAGLAI